MRQDDITMQTAPLPTVRGVPLRHGDFDTLCEALDYAATSQTGFNYFDGKARLKSTLSYSELHAKAIEMAKRLVPFRPRGSACSIACYARWPFIL